MGNSSVQTTAQIIQFPVGGPRLAKPDAQTESPAIAIVDAWYHAAAVQDAKLAGGR